MISIKNIEKKFGKLEVVRNISIEFGTGKVTALVGPNGSGKTTIIKTILGLVKPDAGSVEINGKKVNGDFEYRKDIGYMPQLARFPDNLTVTEVINLIKDLRNSRINPDDNLIKMFDLFGEMNKPIRNLSGGTRQKVSAVIAFMFDPQLLILDEPTAGLDPVSSSNFKDYILQQKNLGKTIILTSHIMSELQELADDIAFILEGRIHFFGSMISLLGSRAEDKLERAIASIMHEAKRWN